LTAKLVGVYCGTFCKQDRMENKSSHAISNEEMMLIEIQVSFAIT